MSDLPQLKSSSRVVAVLVGLGLAFMLGVSLVERISNPHITVQIPSQPQMANGMGGADTGNTIGSLMQQVGQNPDDRHAIMHLVDALMAAQNWEAAEIFAERAMTLDPADSRGIYLLGVIKHNREKHQEAAALLEKVIQIRDDPTVRYSLGVLYIHYLKDAARGIEHLSAGLNDPAAPEELKQALRKELERAPLPDAATKAKGDTATANSTSEPQAGNSPKAAGQSRQGKDSQDAKTASQSPRAQQKDTAR